MPKYNYQYENWPNYTCNDPEINVLFRKVQHLQGKLISKILGGDLSKFTKVVIDKTTKSRMSFAVRDFANHYFNSTDSKVSDKTLGRINKE